MSDTYRTITNWEIKKVTCKEALALAVQHNAIVHPPIWIMEDIGDTPEPYRDMYAWIESQKSNRKIYICKYMGEGYQHEEADQVTCTSDTEHIKELEDALQAIKKMVVGEKKPFWHNDAATYVSRNHIANLCDKALEDE